MNQSTQLNAPPRPKRIGLWVTLAVLAGLAGAMGWRGYTFYRMSLVDRPFHPDFHRLNPAGFLGHGYGMVGTALIVTNLLYLLRRRFARQLPSWIGSIKAWLNLHVFTGLTGSMLVLFHSAFQLRTPIATVTSISLMIVVITGLVGLYIYALVPKEGLKSLNDRLAEIEPLLPGLSKQIKDYVKATPLTTLPHDASLIRTIIMIPKWVWQARSRQWGLRKAARQDKMVRVLEHNERKLARAFYAELSDLTAAELDTHVGAALMRSWRSLHRFLALLMLASVTVHIGVAWYYGFRWIFD